MLVTNYCSPERSFAKDHTCLTKKELDLLVEDYNKTVPVQKKVNSNQPKQRVYKKMQNAFSSVCGPNHNKEYCWVEQSFVTPHTKLKLKTAFRPKKPVAWLKNRRTWLNTYDIVDVMKQYEALYTDFVFLGVFPIDFAKTFPTDSTRCIGRGMCDFDVKSILASRKKRFAMILNLDRHDQNGSHWVSVFCNLSSKSKNYGIYYYDSVALQPKQEVINFMNKVVQQVSSLPGRKPKVEFKSYSNSIQKQTKNTECGVFSMVFLTQMLKDQIPFRELCQRMRTDDGMNELRDVLYRPTVFI